jgi:hypothetical protein
VGVVDQAVADGVGDGTLHLPDREDALVPELGGDFGRGSASRRGAEVAWVACFGSEVEFDMAPPVEIGVHGAP